MRWVRDEYEISTERARVDVDAVHRFLSEDSYWARGIARDVVERSIDNALPFGLYHDGEMIGFARVITDYATFAYLADVYVRPDRRGRGLARWLLEAVAMHPRLQGFRRWLLATRDAHGLYEQVGFAPLAKPGSWMERRPVRSYTDPPAGLTPPT